MKIIKKLSKYWVKIAYFVFAIIYISFSLIIFGGGETFASVAVFLFAIFLTIMGWRVGNAHLELHETYLKICDRNFPYKHITSITKTKHTKKPIYSLVLNLISHNWVYNINTEESTIEILGIFYLGVDNLISKVADKANIRINTVQTYP